MATQGLRVVDDVESEGRGVIRDCACAARAGLVLGNLGGGSLGAILSGGGFNPGLSGGGFNPGLGGRLGGHLSIGRGRGSFRE